MSYRTSKANFEYESYPRRWCLNKHILFRFRSPKFTKSAITIYSVVWKEMSELGSLGEEPGPIVFYIELCGPVNIADCHGWDKVSAYVQDYAPLSRISDHTQRDQ